MSIALLTFPLRPVNGGNLDYAPPKIGDWAAEPKYNGWRSVVHLPTGTMWNRKGQPLSIAGCFQMAIEALREVSPCDWVDVEALERRHDVGKGSLIVLDYILPQTSYLDRRVLIEQSLPILAPCTEPDNNTVYGTASVDWSDAQGIWDDLRAYGATHKPLYEGIVAKRTDSLYPLQTDNPKTEYPLWLKHRYLK